jgi:hypothetical protein
MSESKSIQRPRTGVLAFAAVAVLAVVAYTLWAASPDPLPSNPAREQRPVTAGAAGSGSLAVKLDELKQPPPMPGGEGRNPFRFYVKPAPPPPPPSASTTRVPPPAPVETGPPPPPPIPPIPLKFTGTMEQGKKKVAIFSDGRGVPVYAAEGELVMGQYRVVRIQIESVVMEYADGKGRQTIPMRGSYGDGRGQ